MPWSDDTRVMFRPFRAYTELAALPDERPGRTAAARALLFLFVIGAFVSFTAAGRLVAFHVASSMVAWAFLPIIQGALFALILRFSGPKDGPGMARALGLYFTGHGPWMLFFMALAGMCLFAPSVYATFTWLLQHGVLPVAMLVVIVWSGVITFACFRAGIGMQRGRAAAATALFYLCFSSAILGWYLALNQIQPQVAWLRGTPL